MKIKLIALALIIGAVSGCDGSSESVKIENASVCFNDALYQVGAEYSFVMKEGSDPVDIESFEVMDVAQYKGQEAIRVYDKTNNYNEYISVDSSNKSHTLLGVIDGDPGPNLEKYYSPGLKTKFDLNAGESYEQTYTMIEHDPLNPGDTVYDSVVKFVGIETITVPAGTYKTCKFEDKSTVTSSDGVTEADNTTTWYAVEHGIVVKNKVDDVDDDLVLVEASINGVKI